MLPQNLLGLEDIGSAIQFQDTAPGGKALEKIEELLLRLEGQFGSFIRNQHIEWGEAGGEFDKFSII